MGTVRSNLFRFRPALLGTGLLLLALAWFFVHSHNVKAEEAPYTVDLDVALVFPVDI